MEIESNGLIPETRPSKFPILHLSSHIPNLISHFLHLTSHLSPPGLAVIVGAVVLSLSLVLLPFIERTWRTTGDEPHYLLAAHSLVKDLDFDLRNNYEQLDYLAFYYSKDIMPQVRPSPSGQQILDHHPGLAVLIVPVYALAGRLGVLAFQVLLGGFTVGLTYKLALLISDDRMAALWATLAVVLTPPLFFYQYLVYPELVGALLATLVIYYAVKQDHSTPVAAVLVIVSLVSLPWLNRRFIPLAILLALLIAWAWRRRGVRCQVSGVRCQVKLNSTSSPLTIQSQRPPVGNSQFTIHNSQFTFRLLAPLLATFVSIALLLWFNNQFYNSTTSDITAPYTASLLGERLARGVGWLVDQQRGLFPYAPVYILVLWGAPFLVSHSLRRRNRHWFVLLPFLLSLGVTVVAGGFWVAWELGPRFLVVALPALAPLLALAWRHYGRRKLWLSFALLLFGLSLANTLVIIQNPELPYKSSLPLYYGQKLGLPLSDFLPNLAGYTRISPAKTTPTGTQLISENNEIIWLAEPGNSIALVRSRPLSKLPFGHYRLTWLLRSAPGLPPDTPLMRISIKTSGGGQAFNKVVTAADLPADGSYGLLQYSFLNPTVDRWRTPLVLNVVSTGASRIWAKDIFFEPDLFYAWLLPYLSLAFLIIVGLLAWHRHRDKITVLKSDQERPTGWAAPSGVMWSLTLILPLAALSWLTYQYAQSSRTYDTDDLNHYVGRAIADPQAADGRGWLVDPRVDPPQKAVYGPFDIFNPGTYQVAFRLKLPEPADTDQEIARLQVMATANFDELVIQPLRPEHFDRPNLYHDFILTFTNPRRQALSFEVYYLGVASVVVDQITVTEVEKEQVAGSK